MNFQELQMRMAEIKRIGEDQADDEKAHSMQDQLLWDLLQTIAEGHPLASELAKECLKMQEYDFARWCA